MPCPDCRAHALQNIGKANFSRIVTKSDLQTFLFEFHNIVNKQTRKQQATKDVLTQYDSVSFVTVINEFATTYSGSTNISKLMNDAFRRKRFLAWLKKYLLANGKCFVA